MGFLFHRTTTELSQRMSGRNLFNRLLAAIGAESPSVEVGAVSPVATSQTPGATSPVGPIRPVGAASPVLEAEGLKEGAVSPLNEQRVCYHSIFPLTPLTPNPSSQTVLSHVLCVPSSLAFAVSNPPAPEQKKEKKGTFSGQIFNTFFEEKRLN